MAVYLKVTPRDSRLEPSGGAHTLSGSDCLVFYLGGIPSSSPRHSGGMHFLFGDGSVRFAKDLDAIAAELAQMPARTVGTIILGPSAQTGYVTTRWALSPDSKQAPSLGFTSAGGGAVVIGLLVPAIQAAREAARSKAPSSMALRTLKSLVGPAGHVFVIDSDNALLPV